MTVDASKKIRGLLKAAGYGKADVSVYNQSYSMGSTVYVSIKRPEISLSKVEAIAAAGESIDRDASGEILGGGNCFVDVRYADGALDAAAGRIEEQVAAGRERFGRFSLAVKDPFTLQVWEDQGDGTGRAGMHIDRKSPGPGFARVLAAAGQLDVLDQWSAALLSVIELDEPEPANGNDAVEALVERGNAIAAEMFPAPPAAVRAKSFLSPVEFIGAEPHEADHIGAAIDNLVAPVQAGTISIRDALERVARAAWNRGFGAGDRWARERR